MDEECNNISSQLNSFCENLALNIGASSVLILVERINEDKTYVEHTACTGSVSACITLARNFAIRQDTYVKKSAMQDDE